MRGVDDPFDAEVVGWIWNTGDPIEGVLTARTVTVVPPFDTPGSAVVNIDNGFGAGFLAAQINRMPPVEAQTAESSTADGGSAPG